MQGWTSLVLKEDAAPSQCNSGIQNKAFPSLCLVLTNSLQHSPSASASHLRDMNGSSVLKLFCFETLFSVLKLFCFGHLHVQITR